MLTPVRKGIRATTEQHRLFVSPVAIVLLALVAVAGPLGGGLWLAHRTTQQVTVLNGAGRWTTDQRTTAATIPFLSPEALQIPVDQVFTIYYRTHAGAQLLGAPVTAGFPTAAGWMQVFRADALLLPEQRSALATHTSQADQLIAALMRDGRRDRRTGVIQLPLLQVLLTLGSQAQVLGSGLTYADLRNATHPDQMALAPTTEKGSQRTASSGTFIAEGTRDGQQIGHVIPAPIWGYITRRDVSPDGWRTDFGLPLTEAIPCVTVEYGVSHRLLIQAFGRGALVMHRDLTDASGRPLIQPLETGLAYLQTLTPPAPSLSAQRPLWATGSLDILDTPAAGKAILQIGARFPLIVAGQTSWDAGTLWYRVKWHLPDTSGMGWVPASRTTFTSPGRASATWAPGDGTSIALPGETSPWASFAQLSPALATYLASQGENTGVVVYDLTRQRSYASHLDQQYLMGNSIKVPMLLAFLALREQQGRQVSSNDVRLLTAMMASDSARSENDDAGEQVYNTIGRALGLREYLDQLGITGLTPENDDWLYSLAQPLAMVQLLTRLEEGSVLTPQDRALVFSFLEYSAPDQQVGVGDSSPPGATIALQDGWLIGTDDLWAMNTTGIVTVRGETYVIAVASAHQPSLAAALAIARQVCARVAALLA
jgi:hypothetical protein